MHFPRIPFFTFLLLLFTIVLTHSSYGKVIYVSQNAQGNQNGESWENAIPSISDGIIASSSGDEIWIMAGIYKESVTMQPGVALYGGFVGAESLRDQRNWMTTETVINATGQTRPAILGNDGATLDGFTLKEGEKGGVYIDRGTMNVRNCTVSSFLTNTYIQPYYGNAVITENASLILESCTITGNRSENRGTIRCQNSSITLIDCFIIDNVAENEYEGYGGGLYCDRSTVILTDCTIARNTAFGHGAVGGSYTGGGGINCRDSTLTLRRCWINDNTTTTAGGGITCVSSSLDMFNCVVSGNMTEYGAGAIEITENSLLNLSNCTIVDNVAREGASAFYLPPQWKFMSNEPPLPNGSIVRLTNCILWNWGLEIDESTPGSVTISYSCVQDGWPGEGNRAQYPQFVDPKENDYRLKDGSPCLDSGLSSIAPSFDMDGSIRPGLDGLSDMGAYESPPSYTSATIEIPPLLFVRAEALKGGDGSSWDRAFRSVSDALRVVMKPTEIRIASGRYVETLWLPSDVSLYGGFTGTELNRDERDWMNNKTIVDAGGASYTAVGAKGMNLDGITFTGASGYGLYCQKSSGSFRNCTITSNRCGVSCFESPLILTDCLINENEGEALNLAIGSDAIISNCTIADNTRRAIGINIEDSSPSLTNCKIVRNQTTNNKTAGIHCIEGSPKFTNCLIADNVSSSRSGSTYGGDDACGLRFCRSSPTFFNCIIRNNKLSYLTERGTKTWLAGGMSLQNSTATMDNCVISENECAFDLMIKECGTGGGLICQDSHLILRNCLISNNQCTTLLSPENSAAGGIACLNTTLNIENCSIAGNVFNGEKNFNLAAGGISLQETSLELINSILWNPDKEITLRGNVNETMLSYSCIEDDWPGNENISLNPLFVDSSNGDYRLSLDSPCIDAGDPNESYSDALLPPGLGTKRCDMGVYGGPQNHYWNFEDMHTGILDFMLYWTFALF